MFCPLHSIHSLLSSGIVSLAYSERLWPDRPVRYKRVRMYNSEYTNLYVITLQMHYKIKRKYKCNTTASDDLSYLTRSLFFATI